MLFAFPSEAFFADESQTNKECMIITSSPRKYLRAKFVLCVHKTSLMESVHKRIQMYYLPLWQMRRSFKTEATFEHHHKSRKQKTVK